MKHKLTSASLGRAAVFASLSAVAISPVFTQTTYAGPPEHQRTAQLEQYQNELQQVTNDRAGYADRIVKRWEASAKASDRWDENYSNDLYGALMRLQPDNLLAADKATTYEGMMAVLAKGPNQVITSATTTNAVVQQGEDITPQSLGDITKDLVYTPVTPCRVVDTRVAGGMFAANQTRLFDIDGSDFSAQGGSPTGCGVPYGVARAVMLTIQATQTTGTGYLKAWQYGAAQPISGVLNFNGSGITIANNAAVPDVPGGGGDFNIWASIATHVAITVVGYFAAPEATALNCIQVASSVTPVPVNSWTNIDTYCPSGRTATGGGSMVWEGTLGRPGVWTNEIPIAGGWRTWVDNQTDGPRNVQNWVVCCQVPGR